MKPAAVSRSTTGLVRWQPPNTFFCTGSTRRRRGRGRRARRSPAGAQRLRVAGREREPRGAGLAVRAATDRPSATTPAALGGRARRSRLPCRPGVGARRRCRRARSAHTSRTPSAAARARAPARSSIWNIAMYAPSPRRSRKRPAAVSSCTGDTTSTNVSPNGITALRRPKYATPGSAYGSPSGSAGNAAAATAASRSRARQHRLTQTKHRRTVPPIRSRPDAGTPHG